jgi:hypothetical protein
VGRAKAAGKKRGTQERKLEKKRGFCGISRQKGRRRATGGRKTVINACSIMAAAMQWNAALCVFSCPR